MASAATHRSPTDGPPWGKAIHATAIAIRGAGLVILGPSGAGKSRLAAALVAASTARHPIRLVGDDRILLVDQAAGLVARPHPRIAGFIERRGLGIVACRHVAAAVVHGVVRLGRITTSQAAGEQNFPGLPFVVVDETEALDLQRDMVLHWWRDACTTPAAKSTARLLADAKD